MEINKISNDTQKSMKTRVITAIVMALVGLPCVLFGDWAFIALVILITGGAVWEIIHVTGKKFPWVVHAAMYIFTYSFVFWVFFYDGMLQYNTDFNHFFMNDIRVSTLGVAGLIAFLYAVSIFSERVDVKDVCFLFTNSLFIGISIQSILFLRFSPIAFATGFYANKTYLSQCFSSCALFCFILAGTCLNDIFAYFVGVLFGKHKMNPRVSPKKTWEGFVGGIVLSTMTITGFAILFDLVFNLPLIDGVLDTEHWYYVLLMAVIIPFSGVLGDLMFSLIKRYYGIKDFGKLFPGHGGVLDRFDSLLITALLNAIFITSIYAFLI